MTSAHIEFVIDSESSEEDSHIPEQWTPQETPTFPKGFIGKDFILPKHRKRLLQIMSPHPRDARLKFYEGPHRYDVDGLQTSGSVTGLIHNFSQPFIPNEAIEMMRSGNNWPRPEYSTPNRDRWTWFVEEIMSIPIPEKHNRLRSWKQHLKRLVNTVEGEGDLSAEELKLACSSVSHLVRESPIGGDISPSCITDTDARIRKKWDDNRDEAANRGTWMHLQCELWLNKDGCHTDGVEMKMFLKYVEERISGRYITPYRTEWEIFGEEEDIAGSIDFVGRVEEGEGKGGLVLIDWKRTRDLRAKDRHPVGKTMMYPLDELPDTSKAHYALQLNCYAYIIEKYYGERIVKMEVACFHPDNGDEAYYMEVERMDKEVAYMMTWQRSERRDRILTRSERGIKL
jgi:hypothetical protein